MKWSFRILIYLFCILCQSAPLAAQQGKGLPAWTVSYLDGSVSCINWMDNNPTPYIIPIPNSPTTCAATPVFSRCGEIIMLVSHSGINDSETDLFIFDKEGNPLLTDNTSNEPGLNGNRADEGIQVCIAPGYTDRWYIFYNKWQSDQGAPSSNGAYVPSNMLYSLIQYDGENLNIIERDIQLSSYIYTYGKTLSQPDSTTGEFNLYCCRRAPYSESISIDKYIITKEGVSFEKNSGAFNAPYYYLTYPSSNIEINSDNDQIAIASYDEYSNTPEIFLMDSELNLSSIIEINVQNLTLQPDNNLLYEPLTIDEASYSNQNLGYLCNLSKKIKSLEYSPNGRYLYFCYGGYVSSGISHTSYIGQIDLQSSGPDYDVRLAVQIPPGPFNYSTGAGGSVSNYLNDIHWTVNLQKAYDGNIYFTKANSSTLYLLKDPDEPIEQMLTPGDVNLSKEERNIAIQGIFHFLPSGIDGYNYIDPLKFDLGTDTCFFQGESVRIYGPEEYDSFLWQDGSTNEYFDATEEGMVIVEAFDPFGCSYTDSIFVNKITADEVFIGNDTTICGEFSLTLDAGEGFLSYQWNNGSSEQTFTVDTAGLYWVEAETECGPVRDSILINQRDFPVFSLGNDTTICNGDYLAISGPPATEYLWQDGSTDPIHSARNHGIYWLRITDEFGCSYQDSLCLTISQPEILLPPDTMICDNDSILLIAGSSLFDFEWFDGSIDTAIWAYIQGTYSVTATDSLGCTATKETIINHIDLPVVELGQDTGFCDYDTLSYAFDTPYTTYIWNDTDTAQRFIPVSGGTYWVNAYNRCGEAADTITLEKYLSPEVYLGPDTLLFPGEEILLDAGAGYISYLWNNSATAPSINVGEPGEYFVTVWNEHCMATDSVKVKAVPPFYVPNVFTPNNDGYNDDFEILGEYLSKFQLFVVNRWGETLFETNNINDRWDGTFMGRPCHEGVYFWIIRYQHPNESTPTTIQGTVTIIID